MKYTVIIDDSRDEEVVVYLREPRAIAEKIEKLVLSESCELIGYGDNQIFRLSKEDIYSVYVENGCLFASTEYGRLRLRERLYTVEQMMSEDFLKINQSCIVSIDRIERFDVTPGGALTVIMKNGYKDYVSRRQMKAVKERLGIKR